MEPSLNSLLLFGTAVNPAAFRTVLLQAPDVLFRKLTRGCFIMWIMNTSFIPLHMYVMG